MRKKIFKKIILGILISLFILPLFIRPALAYPGIEGGSYQFQFEEAIKSDEMNLQSFVNETIKAIAGSIAHVIIGSLNPFEESKTVGLLPATGILIAGLYANPPASGIQYFSDLGKNLGITKPVYALGEKIPGFKAMEATQAVWRAFRNVTYVLFALILVAMGFAIMFRVKISPQAVITIQAALPKIIIALVLITFSYAIVGLMIDVTYGVIDIIASIFRGIFTSPASQGGLAESWVGFFANINENWVGKIYHFLIPNAFDANPLLKPLTNAFLTVNAAISVFYIFSYTVFTIFGPFLSLIVGILVLIAFIRCLWTLLKAFTMVVVNLIFAPFRILIGVFPGSNAISGWFKDLLANLAVLPTMILIFYLASYFILKGVPNAMYEVWHDWYKNLTPWTVEFSTNELTYILFPFIGLALLLLSPRVADIIQSFITKKPFQYGTAIGEYGQALYRGTTMAYEQYKTKTGKAEQSKRHEELLRALKGEEISKPGSR